MEYKIIEERLTANEYIEFLKHTDLGSQYPKERFEERINTLVNKVSISLVARNVCNEITYGNRVRITSNVLNRHRRENNENR